MPIARFQMPDGRIARFEVPEGTTPEQAQQSFLQWQATQPKPVDQAPVANKQPEVSTMDKITAPIRAFGHHFFNPLHGGAQLIEHGISSGLDAVAPNSGIARYVRDTVASDDAALAAREADYQARTPDGALVTSGAVLGDVLPFLLSGGRTGFLTKGAQIAERAAARAGVGAAGRTAASVGGQVASNAAGGAVAGALQPVINNPSGGTPAPYWDQKASQTGTGAAIGALLPAAGTAVKKTTQYGVRAVKSLVRPLSNKGQEQIAVETLKRLADGGPVKANMTEFVPGSTPTTAQATGNAGLAGAERVVRDMNPNAFQERIAQNQAARRDMVGRLVQSPQDVKAMETARNQAVEQLYTQARGSSILMDNKMKSMLTRPIMQRALARAQQLADNEGAGPIIQSTQRRNMVGGLLPTQDQYMTGNGMHYLKMALDDLSSGKVEGIAGNESRAAGGLKDELIGWAEKVVPEYGEARRVYAQLSKPIEAQRYLQDLNITDAQGNVTLQKLDSAIKRIMRDQADKGLNPAKSITKDQLNALRRLRADMQREARSGAGRPAGSDTFQRAATNEVMGNLLPAPLQLLVKPGSASNNLLARGLGVVYGDANKAVNEQMRNMLLDPAAFSAALNRARANAAQPAQGALQQTLLPYLAPASIFEAGSLVGRATGSN